MSYREENDQVILTMSREDYENLVFKLGMSAGYLSKRGKSLRQSMKEDLEFLNRLNEGNPNYTPYQVRAEK
jgi:hypothetical protein